MERWPSRRHPARAHTGLPSPFPTRGRPSPRPPPRPRTASRRPSPRAATWSSRSRRTWHEPRADGNRRAVADGRRNLRNPGTERVDASAAGFHRAERHQRHLDGSTAIASFDRQMENGYSKKVRTFRRQTMAAKLGLAAPGLATPSGDWLRLGRSESAFQLVADWLAEGGLGAILPPHPGPSDATVLPATDDMADPDGSNGATCLATFAGLIAEAGTELLPRIFHSTNTEVFLLRKDCPVPPPSFFLAYSFRILLRMPRCAQPLCALPRKVRMRFHGGRSSVGASHRNA